MTPRLPDVTVIGAGLGGLSAAIHLRLAGHRVRVFEANAAIGGRANVLRVGGQRFDTGPSLLNYPWIFEDLFAAAGRHLGDFLRLRRIEPTIVFHWPDGRRLTLASEKERLAAELENFEASASHKLDEYLADAKEKFRIAFEKLIPRNESRPLTYFAVLTCGELLRTALWRSMYAEIGRFFRSRHIREALGSYAMYLGGSPFSLPGLFSMLPYGELAYGLWYPEGGIYALVEAIGRLARSCGVEIHVGRTVSRILHREARVTAVELADGERIAADVVVCNADLPTVYPQLLGEPPPRLAMSPAVLTYYWVLRQPPAGLSHHTIFLPGNYRPAFRHLLKGQGIPTQLAFYVAAPDASQPGPAPASPSRVFVLVPVPVLSRLTGVGWPEAVAEVRDRVLERLAAAGIVLRAGDILAERVWTPPEWAQRFRLYDGSAFGAAHTLGQVGPFRPPNYSRRFRGLYFVGASTQPGTGLPMVVLSGKLTAARIAAHVRSALR